MKYLLILCFTFSVTNVFAQVKIGTGATTPDASAVLDIESNSKGLLIPRLSTSQMNAVSNPARGLLVFNSTDSVFYMRLDTGWTKIATGNNIWISNGAAAFNSNPGNIGIGTNTPVEKLDLTGNFKVDGNIYLPNSTPTTGVIYKEGLPFLHNAGLVAQQNVYLGTNAGSFNTLAKKNVAIGSNALANSDGADNIAIGFNAARNLIGGSSYTESFKNLFVGYLCGEEATGGINNVALGVESGYNLKAGSTGNVVIGASTGRSMTTGIGNVLMGNSVQTETGNLNTGIGGNSGLFNVGGSYNSWYGADAYKSNKNGWYNTAIGIQTEMEDTVGSFNLYMGAFAGKFTQGGNNVFIGTFAGSGDANNLDNKFILNNSNSTLHLMDGDFINKRVGVKMGFASLNYTLDIGGEIRIGGSTSAPTPSNGVVYFNTAENKLKTYENSSWKNMVYDNIMGQKNGDPNTSDVPLNSFHVWKNTGNGNVYLWVNDGGTMKKVQLQ